MPRNRRVPSLLALSLRSTGEYVAAFGKDILRPLVATSTRRDLEASRRELRAMLMVMKELLLINVPWNLYDDMAKETLLAIQKLINETKGSYNDYTLLSSYLSEINVVVSLTEVVVSPRLRSIEFTSWPKIMRHVLYQNLGGMTGLEVLDLGSGSAGWKTSNIEKSIISGVSAMPNLRQFVLCFDCTDNIVAAIADNCRKLVKFDAMASRLVTDRAVNSLLNLPNLRIVNLCRTSITVHGYTELFSRQAAIEDIGRCDEFGYVLESLTENAAFRFAVKVFESRSFSAEHLSLLIDMCPNITSLCIVRDENVGDLAILACLSRLTELKLLSCGFYRHGVKTLMELKGTDITSLHLEHVEEIDLNALICISQFCPLMKSLVFYNCEFLERPTSNWKFIAPPFQCLESIKCAADCAAAHIEFLLTHCLNVKYIQLGSSTGIGDAVMLKILSRNPMTDLEELKILFGHDLSMKTVRLLMRNCANLRRLSELECWQGISAPELETFRRELQTNNVNLDISPTLSFA